MSSAISTALSSVHIQDQNGDAGLEMRDVPNAAARTVRIVCYPVQPQTLAREAADRLLAFVRFDLE